MFPSFYDSKRNIVFITKTRCGSSTLRRVCASGNYPELKLLPSLEHAIDLCFDPSVQVIATFRSPKIQYMSGLYVHVNNFLQANNKVETPVSKKTKYSKYLRKIVKGWEDKLPTYDYNDHHCSHSLWLQTTLLIGGANVELIPLNKWSECLIKYYPNNNDDIFEEHSDATMYDRHDSAERIVDISFENMVLSQQKGSTNPNTWEKWMEPEMALFNSLLKYIDDLDPKHLNYGLNCISGSDSYWASSNNHISDLNSKSLIRKINTLRPGALPDSLVLRAKQP